jgi:hypothetical protein
LYLTINYMITSLDNLGVYGEPRLSKWYIYQVLEKVQSTCLKVHVVTEVVLLGQMLLNLSIIFVKFKLFMVS